MVERSPFSDEWRQCQIENYQHMVRSGTPQQRADARAVMLDAGFDEAEVNALYVQATMHMDEVPDDFVPDAAVIEQLRQEPHPSDCTCPSCRAGG